MALKPRTCKGQVHYITVYLVSRDSGLRVTEEQISTGFKKSWNFNSCFRRQTDNTEGIGSMNAGYFLKAFS